MHIYTIIASMILSRGSSRVLYNTQKNKESPYDYGIHMIIYNNNNAWASGLGAAWCARPHAAKGSRRPVRARWASYSELRQDVLFPRAHIQSNKLARREGKKRKRKLSSNNCFFLSPTLYDTETFRSIRTVWEKTKTLLLSNQSEV